MNQLKITHSLEGTLLVSHVAVDAAPLMAGFAVNLRELAASARASGDFWIFACGCGTPGCGGIERGVVVTHSAGQTRWLVPRANSRREFEFDSGEYRAAVMAALTQVRSLQEEMQEDRALVAA